MKIEKGYYVKCFLKNGFAVEGIVLKWDADEIEIECSDDNSITIIHNPSEELFVTKISLKDPAEIFDKNSKIDEQIKPSRRYDQELSFEEQQRKQQNNEGALDHYDYPGFFKNKNTQ